MVLARLRAEAQEMKAAKKVLTKSLKNARRVNARLKAKARKLSDAELLQIVAMRNGVAVVAPMNKGSSSSTSAASSSCDREQMAVPGAVAASVLTDDRDDDDAVASGSASSHDVDLQRLADRMEM